MVYLTVKLQEASTRSVTSEALGYEFWSLGAWLQISRFRA